MDKICDYYSHGKIDETIVMLKRALARGLNVLDLEDKHIIFLHNIEKIH